MLVVFTVQSLATDGSVTKGARVPTANIVTLNAPDACGMIPDTGRVKQFPVICVVCAAIVSELQQMAKGDRNGIIGAIRPRKRLDL
jgi:hypothetical protein